jgi:mannose-6-phosphate isomerase-like protein (cupin superfamily)
MDAKVYNLDALCALAGPNAEAKLFRASDERGWVNVVHKDHAKLVSESHDAETDIYVILSGRATITLGGTLDAPTSPRPGQWRGTGITGGEETVLEPGQLVIIPAGVAHMVDTREGTLQYVVIKQVVG